MRQEIIEELQAVNARILWLERHLEYVRLIDEIRETNRQVSEIQHLLGTPKHLTHSPLSIMTAQDLK